MHRFILPFLAGLCPVAAIADEAGSLSLSLPLSADTGVVSEQYRCGDLAPFTVRYINAQPNFIAILPVEGTMRVFVSVIAASGVRYVSGPFEWWTKGDSATLRNEMEEGTGAECEAVESQ